MSIPPFLAPSLRIVVKTNPQLADWIDRALDDPRVSECRSTILITAYFSADQEDSWDLLSPPIGRGEILVQHVKANVLGLAYIGKTRDLQQSWAHWCNEDHLAVFRTGQCLVTGTEYLGLTQPEAWRLLDRHSLIQPQTGGRSLSAREIAQHLRYTDL